jgi:hypothetical protein
MRHEPIAFSASTSHPSTNVVGPQNSDGSSVRARDCL